MYVRYDGWSYPEWFASIRMYRMFLVGVLVGSGLPGNDCPVASILYQVSHVTNN
jgi:hypothetical protein